ncbi:TPA: hypothetical protein ROE93_001865 [Campylobacter jejuni]|nr:hypothetical protein [Campylobacter jejuni]HAN0606438.1 hypothetical protein [Campylobacter jejuni]HDX3566688.1 hypothetical protein [Campylobacter jejuni]HDX3784773.1 hypothetical protein [Campylobacter jejuni]HEA7300193.1 hypothetical protein [Campylobacter jejuni]
MKLQDFDFRVWDKHHKGCGNKDCKCQTKYVYGEEAKTRLSEFKEDCEMELFTGLYDKKGKKVYENDIVKNESLEEIYYITRDNTYKMFKIIIYDKDCNENLYRKKNPADINLLKMLVSDKNMSVIGNIHENPELLKC